ncbi:peptide deformylase [uncultured Shewanella sp.]|uniref:peptide deformylase n=1 Tax=uncultured Shewanella sp. TaxID=173975 RepID=UPI00262D02DA|nr:peptide deformylase [uncultured Shewanella sp.]
MAVLDILTAPDLRLKSVAKTVVDFESIQALIDDMLETLYATSNGIGLAATQVGRSEAIVIIDISQQRNEPLILVNPKVVSGKGKRMGQEGCLSVPNFYADVERFSVVTVTAQNRFGQEISVESDDFLAIVVQHEIDHLNGNLFIDYLSPLKRQRAINKVVKRLKKAS